MKKISRVLLFHPSKFRIRKKPILFICFKKMMKWKKMKSKCNSKTKFKQGMILLILKVYLSIT